MGHPVPNSTVVGNIVIEGIHGGDPATTEIPIRGFDMAATQTEYRDGTGGRGAVGVKYGDFRIVKAVDAASTKLMAAHAKGTRIPSVVVTVNRPGVEPPVGLMTYRLTDVLIMALSRRDDGSEEPGIPLEDVRFDFGAIEETYTTSDGQAFTSGWDVERNRPL